ncbi:hypothetical protein A7A08_01580 [Methyloligella halotolerans]|uniref:Uncharacterized protein n=1 Tax=Methyloligella halotolerans TaxID=1177755 RepID=A0A1E2RZ79_9HYPH|nr:hypothetical protein [Methyloligella halotolerans]ODA67546.1 hypothetical protein A7A08_01580 [Methyloligella halotolerans]
MDVTAEAFLLLAAGIFSLRWAWLQKRGEGRGFVVGGWLAIVSSFYVFAHVFGGERGITFALLAFSIAGLLAVTATLQLRNKRSEPRDRAMEPEQRRTNWMRAIGKSLLAVVLAGAAAIGVGVAFAVAMPMPATDKMIIGGLMVPILWGGGMAWTLADSKLLRATAILLIICAVGYGIAFLPNFVS